MTVYYTLLRKTKPSLRVNCDNHNDENENKDDFNQAFV